VGNIQQHHPSQNIRVVLTVMESRGLHAFDTSSAPPLQVGLLDEEKILPVGQEITAVGTLGMMPDGKPVIKPCKKFPVFLYDQILSCTL